MTQCIVHLPLSRGYQAIINEADFPLVGGFKWSVKIGAGELRYAQRAVVVDGKKTIVLLHRELLGLAKGSKVFIDFVDGNGLNCTRANMRTAASSNVKTTKLGHRMFHPNEINRREDGVVEISLYDGHVCLVDEADWGMVAGHHWVAFATDNLRYALTHVYLDDQRRTPLFMHRLLLGLERGDKANVYHKDRNGLNNRRCNLRLATASQNRMNSGKRKEKASKYNGVTLIRRKWKLKRPWLAGIYVNGKQICLGYFSTEIEAAKAYNQAAVGHYGNFACLNEFETEQVVNG